MKLFRDQKGIALMYAMIGLSFVSILLFFLADNVLLLTKQTARKISLTEGRMIVHSILDYTIYGVKQRWCFDDDWLPAKKCDMTHTRAVERLIMNSDSAKIFGDMVTEGVITGTLPNPIILKSFSAEVDLKSILPAHPLYQIVNAVGTTNDLKTARIMVERDKKVNLPNGGRHIFIKVSVTILDSKGKKVFWQDLPLEGTAGIGVFPRELGTFSLIVGNDLRLDKPYNMPQTPGDANVHLFGSKAEFNGLSGLIFESPVFVNGNIVMPPTSETEAEKSNYAPVTFADKVYLGGGQIYRASKLFEPKSAGALNDQTWDGVKEFGGFQRGVEVDGSRDLGLDVLNGRQGSNPPDESIMQKCLQLVGVRSNLIYTKNSHLAAAFRGGDLNSGALYRLGFSDGNWITPQKGNTGLNSVSHPGDTSFQGGAGKPVALVTVKVANRKFTASVAVGNSVSLRYAPGRSKKLPGLNADLATETDPLKKAKIKAEIDRLEEIASRQGQLTIEALGSNINGNIQPIFADVRIKATPTTAFVDSEGSQEDILFQVMAYDVGCDKIKCRPNSQKGPDFSQDGFLKFSASAGGADYALPKMLASSPGGGDRWSDIPDEAFDWAGLEKTCTYSPKSAFGGSDWGTSFLDSTALAWHFAPGNPSLNRVQNLSYTIELTNSDQSTFKVVSLVGTCKIKASALRVSGFFNCNKLVIEDRHKPLDIVGTFIVQGMEIHPNALKAGIRWKTIYHPQAVYQLRAWGMLRPQNGFSCNAIGSPIWHPFPGLPEQANFVKCNSLYLRAKADPFTWTAVDPDCGLLPGKGNTICKNRMIRFVVHEFTRESAL